MKFNVVRSAIVGVCIVGSGLAAGRKSSDAPQSLADQKAAITGAGAPPGELQAIKDAQAREARQSQTAQEHAKSGQAAAQAAAAAKGH